MRGFIKYEMICMKKVIYMYLAFMVFYLILGILGMGPEKAGTFVMFFSIFFSVGVLSQWEQYHWDIMAAAMPLSRRQVIGSLYLICLCVLGVGVAFAFIAYAGVYFVKPDGAILGTEDLAVIGLWFCMALIYTGIVIPVLIRFGSIKGRFIGLAILIIPCLILVIVSRNINEAYVISIVNQNFRWLAVGSSMAAVAAFVISLFVSVRIYEKRDL